MTDYYNILRRLEGETEMIFNCEKEDLVNAINTVQKAVPSKTPMQYWKE